MKKIFCCLVILIFSAELAYPQNKDKVIRALADSAVKLFTWDIKKEDKGTLMFLDVAFDHGGKTEYLSLTVAKDKSKDRPVFISVIVPSDINQDNGIFMTFAKSVKRASGESNLEIAKDLTVRLNFEKCDNRDCIARIINSYADDKESNKKVDILKSMLAYDHVLFLFLYADGGHKSVAVPLFSFKAQYKTLP